MKFFLSLSLLLLSAALYAQDIHWQARQYHDSEIKKKHKKELQAWHFTDLKIKNDSLFFYSFGGPAHSMRPRHELHLWIYRSGSVENTLLLDQKNIAELLEAQMKQPSMSWYESIWKKRAHRKSFIKQSKRERNYRGFVFALPSSVALADSIALVLKAGGKKYLTYKLYPQEAAQFTFGEIYRNNRKDSCTYFHPDQILEERFAHENFHDFKAIQFKPIHKPERFHYINESVYSFDRNSYTFKKGDLELISKFFANTSTRQVDSLTVRILSSVEGDEGANLALSEKRGQSVINYLESNIPGIEEKFTEIEYVENFELFCHQLYRKDSLHPWLDKNSEEIKTALENPSVRKEYEFMLRDQRKGEVTIYSSEDVSDLKFSEWLSYRAERQINIPVNKYLKKEYSYPVLPAQLDKKLLRIKNQLITQFEMGLATYYDLFFLISTDSTAIANALVDLSEEKFYSSAILLDFSRYDFYTIAQAFYRGQEPYDGTLTRFVIKNALYQCKMAIIEMKKNYLWSIRLLHMLHILSDMVESGYISREMAASCLPSFHEPLMAPFRLQIYHLIDSQPKFETRAYDPNRLKSREFQLDDWKYSIYMNLFFYRDSYLPDWFYEIYAEFCFQALVLHQLNALQSDTASPEDVKFLYELHKSYHANIRNTCRNTTRQLLYYGIEKSAELAKNKHVNTSLHFRDLYRFQVHQLNLQYEYLDVEGFEKLQKSLNTIEKYGSFSMQPLINQIGRKHKKLMQDKAVI
ncbi:MAG: hypothetical protein LAT68_08185 [Cyclobacteriaceae bacterium]|nr:hypothetical protein [Cyclobacteriaceae bacterium]MCH8516293.1 hypothetical protein [Cyclobacteriaceae bacterium]